MRKKLLILGLMVGVASLFLIHPMVSAATTSGSGDIVVQSIPGPSLAQLVTDKFVSSWPWYLVRGSGVVAALALVVLILSGIGSVTGHTFKFLEPITAWASHRALGIVFGISILIHMFGLLFDHFVSFDLPQILVPWLSSYKPVTILGINFGSLYVAFGVIAFYLVALIVIVSLFWIDKRPKLWKLTHLLSYLVLVLVFLHVLFIGSDSGGLLRLAGIGTFVGLAALSLYRWWRSYSL